LKLQTEFLWENRFFLLKGARRSGSSAETYKHTTGATNTVNLDAVYFSISPSTADDGFGGLAVSMLASGSQVRGFKPGRSRWIFLYVKILSLPSFGGEVNLSDVPTLRHVKEPRICSELRLAS
jgi:hypothetical protein